MTTVLKQVLALLTVADDRGDGGYEIDQAMKLIEQVGAEPETAATHKWVDGWGNERESEAVSWFNRGEFRWVTIWDERLNEFRTLPAGSRLLHGAEAFEQLTEEEQNTLTCLVMDEVADMSSRERAHDAMEEMTLDEMREYLREDDDLGDDPLGDWHGRNE